MKVYFSQIWLTRTVCGHGYILKDTPQKTFFSVALLMFISVNIQITFLITFLDLTDSNLFWPNQKSFINAIFCYSYYIYRYYHFTHMFWWVYIVHIFSFLCCVFCLFCLSSFCVLCSMLHVFLEWPCLNAFWFYLVLITNQNARKKEITNAVIIAFHL